MILEHSTFPKVSSVYKLYGTKEWHTTDNWVVKGAAAGVNHPAADILWANDLATNDAENLNEDGDWEVDAASLGEFNTHGTVAVAKSTTSWSDATTIYPGATATDVTIAASVTGTLTDTLNDDLVSMKAAGLTHAASAHYMIHSFIKYWNGATINWTLTNSSAMF